MSSVLTYLMWTVFYCPSSHVFTFLPNIPLGFPKSPQWLVIEFTVLALFLSKSPSIFPILPNVVSSAKPLCPNSGPALDSRPPSPRPSTAFPAGSGPDLAAKTRQLERIKLGACDLSKMETCSHGQVQNVWIFSTIYSITFRIQIGLFFNNNRALCVLDFKEIRMQILFARLLVLSFYFHCMFYND